VRQLTDEEIDFARKYFGGNLDNSHQHLRVGRIFGLRAISPGFNRMWFPLSSFKGEDQANSLKIDEPYHAGEFAHELLHVLQAQQGHNVLLHGAFLQARHATGRRNVYSYDKHVHDPADFLSLYQRANMEQQGQMVQDYVFAMEMEAIGKQGPHDLAKYNSLAEMLRS